MNPIFRRLTCLLMLTGLLVSFAVLWAPGLVHAAATCTPQATLAADIPPNGPLDTGANVIATFNNARQQEGCNVSLSIDPAAYDAATPQMQELLLVNAERQDRGLGVLQLDTTLLSQIDLNHSQEMVQYNYFGHSSPINQPGGKNDSITRITVNPAVNGHNTLCCAENIAGGGPAGDAIYRFMYEDSASNWGHRQNILGYAPLVDNAPGHYTWIGIGIATGGQFGFYSTLDFLQDSTSTTYTPPATADTQPPTMNPPTIVDANTVQVTNVHDNSDGNTTGAAGVTGVVFYVGSAVDPSGNFLTVVATQTATAGTWTVTLAATDLSTLHAVAVDGSGNFNDCVGNATSC
jgi:uncharacterized protein YkwD